MCCMRCSSYVIATTSELPTGRHRVLSQQQTSPPSPPASATDDQDDLGEDLQLTAGEFYVIEYVHHREPVHGFLGRHLRRRLLLAQLSSTTSSAAAAAAAGGGTSGCSSAGRVTTSELARVVDWLPRVWHKVNRFLDVVSPPSKLDITIGNFCTEQPFIV